MKKIVLAVALLMLGTSVYAEESIVILKKDCSISRSYTVVCSGLVKNIGRTDIQNVFMFFAPTVTPESLSGLEKKYADLPASVKEAVTKAVSTPAADKFEYIPAGDTLPFRAEWNVGILAPAFHVLSPVGREVIARTISMSISMGETSVMIVHP